MAARRERERRRPGGERRYNFARAEPALEPDETSIEQDEEATEAVVEAPSRSSRAAVATPQAPAPGKVSARASKPFSAYKDEYAYVYGDLRRVGLVIGSLLVILIVLYFVLPLLAR
jgi:hypothetical protein